MQLGCVKQERELERLTSKNSKTSQKSGGLLCRRVRAIWDDDKSSREMDLINSAKALFEARDYADIGILDICKNAGLAKGTFYLYFKSKEEVFLKLTLVLFEQWGARIVEQLQLLNEHVVPSAIATAYVTSCADASVLIRLTSMLHSVIEKNVPVDEIVIFKRKLAQIQMQQMSEISRIFPKLDPLRLGDFSVFITNSIIGTWTLSNPPKSARAALEIAGLSDLVVDFENTLRRQIEFFLKGLLMEGS